MKIEDQLQMSNFENEFQKLFFNIILTAQNLEERSQKELKNHDLTTPQYNVLRILRGQKGNAISTVEIQQRMIHKTSNISRILDKLEAKDLALRKDSDINRRKREVFITAKGLKILNQTEYIPTTIYKDIKAVLSNEEAKEINDQLDNIRNFKIQKDVADIS